MKHQHCHCHLRERIRDLKAGKLGLLGGILIIGHLLFHVAECLVLPVILVALHGEDDQTQETLELTEQDLHETHTHVLFSMVNINGQDILHWQKFSSKLSGNLFQSD